MLGAQLRHIYPFTQANLDYFNDIASMIAQSYNRTSISLSCIAAPIQPTNTIGWVMSCSSTTHIYIFSLAKGYFLGPHIPPYT